MTGSDHDWYIVYFDEYGSANFWLGDIPSGKDYEFELYDYAGRLIRGSYGSSTQEQIYNQEVTPNNAYYLHVFPLSSNHYSSSYYRMRAKVYPVATPTFTYKYTASLSGLKYYLADTTYAQAINDALYNWQSPPSNVGTNRLGPISKVSSKSSADMEFETYAESTTDDLGVTGHYTSAGGSGYTGPNDRNWIYCKVMLNSYNINQQSGSLVARGVAAHEIGHVFGLAHNNSNPYSIMCQLSYGRKVRSISKTDNDAFNRKYP